jgi:hypothetical protein
LVALAGAFVVGVEPRSRAGDPESPALTAARKRQEAVKTLAVEFTVTQSIPQGGIAKALGPPLNEPFPDHETTVESKNRLLIDGDKVRYEENHVHFFKPGRDVIQLKKVYVYDGSATTTLFPPLTGDGVPSGVINTADQDFTSPVLDPIGHTFRPMNRLLFSLPIAAMQRSGATLSIDEDACEELVFEPPRTPGTSKEMDAYYLDTTKDYVVRRIVHKLADLPSRQHEISYRRDDAQRWVPATWEIKEYARDGQVRAATKVVVTNLRINEAIRPEEFGIKFPEGSRLYNQNNNKNYQVQADGSLHEDNANTGNMLPASVAPPAHWYQNKWLLVGGAIALAAGFVGTYFLRRKRGGQA